MLLAERDGDAVAELHELGLGEHGMQTRPEGIVGALGVPGDRVGPGQRGPLALGVAVGILGVVDDVRVLGEVACAEVLELGLDDSRLKKTRG